MKIAVTGGIGSGKSEILKVADKLSVATVSCDEINKDLLKDESYLTLLRKEFPGAFTDGGLDKNLLSGIIYSDEKMREKLNSIAHPLIFNRIKEDTRDPLVVEIPLMNSDVAGWFDEIIYVHTEKDRRLDFLEKNRGMKKEDAIKIMSTQNSEEELFSFATKVIYNTESFEEFSLAAEELLKSLL